jgi:hypothetical protein
LEWAYVAGRINRMAWNKLDIRFQITSSITILNMYPSPATAKRGSDLIHQTADALVSDYER